MCSSNGKESRVAEEEETVILPPTISKWKLSSRKADGDVALALFSDPDELHEPIDPAEEAKLVRQIDFRILILIGVCYAFFYIDKTTVSPLRPTVVSGGRLSIKSTLILN